MKYGKTYEDLLASNENYAAWSTASIRYKALKKIIANLSAELSDVGLDAVVLRELFANAQHGSIHGLNEAHIERLESAEQHQHSAGLQPEALHLNASAEYELGGTSEQPAPRIKLIFDSDSSASEGDDITDAALLQKLHDKLLIKKPKHSVDSTTETSDEERFDDLTDSDAPDTDKEPETEEPLIPRTDSKLMLRIYGFGVDPKRLATPPGSPPATPKNNTPTAQGLRTPRASIVPDLELPLPSLSSTKQGNGSQHMNGDADTETYCTPVSRKKRRRHRRVVYIPLKTDTQFFALLAQAIDALQKLEVAQKEEFAARVDALVDAISRCCTPSRSKADMYAWRDVLSLWIEAQVFESARERDRGERSLADATQRLHWFVDEVGRRKLARKFKLKESRSALQSFLDVNESLLDLKKFIEANEEAARKILKKHDKRTALSAAQEFPQFRAATSALTGGQDLAEGTRLTRRGTTDSQKLLSFGTESLPHVLLSTLTRKLLPVVPQLDDFTCMICGDVAFRPIKLDCGHKFCVRCLVKMQRRKQDACPHCRAPVVLKADQANLDLALEQFLLTYFPKEVKLKEKSNHKEATREAFGTTDPQKCQVM